ncbi:MAG: hypothetical protein HY904_04580 [Deltaproteobacteria bacterium]|nr:hypothetical protein [Deltaproteobacteria bacterium]
MLRLGIATECDDYDGEVFRFLVERLLARPVERWQTEIHFYGDRSVKKLAGAYMRLAARSGVRDFLFAVDNDGGARRRPEHAPDHDVDAQAADEKDGCRWCWLERATAGAVADVRCVVVPVQTLETWLLVARGDALHPAPEKVFHRSALKKQFFGPHPLPPTEQRTQVALAALELPGGIARLGELASFRQFEVQLEPWRG